MTRPLKVKKKEPVQRFSIQFPVSLLEEIDQLCSANYITRTSWLINAALQLLGKVRAEKTEEMIRKIAEKERGQA